ncbi:chaperonin 10-like protein [Massariosphaeria phaeospora]|uniref:Chaperonin 10-like protein n=1 Tax=Massariosphaeria phaeospora TaxID=100035 RepID=A0A7C8IAN7_9PLEO|nr:chaperonin 10-like protein [Massariosphaeria phaeospora]
MATTETNGTNGTIFTTQHAIRQHEHGRLAVDADAPMPFLPPNGILVRTVAVALAPTDYKMPEKFPTPGVVSGCDFAGTIVKIGSEVERPLKAGDRVFGGIHGANPAEPTSGSFAEYLVADAEFVFLVPEDMPWETAAAMSGIGIGTTGLAIFYYLKPPGTLEKPAEKPVTVLVNGGATASGTMAIQLLRLAGLNPIATCSPKNNDLVTSYGASAVFSYHDDNCAALIRSHTKNALKYVLDCVATASAIELCHAAIGRLGGTYIALEMPPPLANERKTVKTDWCLGMSLLGKEIQLGDGYGMPANEEHHRFGIQLYGTVQRLLDEGKLRAHPVRMVEGGLQGVLDEGLGLLRAQKVSAQKLVAFI